jgi:hypothetical protein
MVLFKIWFLIAILPFTIAKEAYLKLKVFLDKRGIKIDWLYVSLVALIILLIILLLAGFR